MLRMYPRSTSHLSTGQEHQRGEFFAARFARYNAETDPAEVDPAEAGSSAIGLFRGSELVRGLGKIIFCDTGTDTRSVPGWSDERGLRVRSSIVRAARNETRSGVSACWSGRPTGPRDTARNAGWICARRTG